MKRFMILILALSLLTAISAQSDYADLSDTSDISISLVNQDPDPAIAGDIVELRLGIENRGGESIDLNMQINPEYPFELIPGESSTQDIGIVRGYQTDENMQIAKYKLRVDRDAPAGTYELKVEYWDEGASSTVTKSLNIDVKNKESAEIIHIDRTSLIPGKQESMMFTITNVGNAPLRDMTFYWENEDDIILPVGSDNTKYVKYIDIGESSVLEYQVVADTNADPGLYKLDLHLAYDDPITGEDKEIATIAGIYVGGATDFDVAFSESAGQEVSFSIANVGSNPAYSVSVLVPEQDGYKISGSNTVIIGNLNKGDYTVATFNLQGRGDVAIQIAYTDTKGERRLVEKNVTLSQTSNKTGAYNDAMRAKMAGQNKSIWSQYGIFIVVILIVVAILVFRNWYKKRKLKNPKFKLIR